MKDILPVRDFIKPFIEAGLVPENCRRIIIDLQTDSAVKVYYEVYGSQEVLDLLSKMVEDNTFPKGNPE